ncbi:MAG: DNA topoisomerase (ATP-hydrolyzing) subunit B [Chitinophagales bacterium]|nr:DNA topoisomerase (ATP-hydrolyzing) subunit B [Chitinophagales bacterium]
MSENLEQTNNYGAESIQTLKGLEAVRMRPGMYVGGTDSRALHHLVNEVLDNSIDEALAGFCTEVITTILENGAMSIKDNGRGIPTGIQKDTGRSALELVMTELHAGGKFDKNSYKVSGGLNGVGVSCVNALSSHLRAVVHREGKIFEQEYREGKPQYDVREIGTSNDTGTEVIFQPDASIFDTVEFRYEFLANRMKELSFLNKGVKLILVDERVKNEDGQPKQETFFSENGLIDFVSYLDQSRTAILPKPIFIVGESEGVVVEVSFQYNTSYTENIFSFANNIQTIMGGTHVNGFKRAIAKCLKDYGDKNGIFAKMKVSLSAEDFREGLTAIVSVKVPNPQFRSQTKDELSNAEVTSVVSQAVTGVLEYYLEENPKESRVILEKVMIAANARHAAKKARELVQRKTVLTGSGLPGKLADCSEKDPGLSEIFLVEGDSAGGTAKTGRDRKFQAIMPLRGKILNVEKALEHKIYENEEIRNIFTALGVSIGTENDQKQLNIEKLRYHKIVIMCDADVDGSHITTLILTFFFRFMRPLVESGYVYVASPPLYQVKKGKKMQYCWNDKQRDEAIKELGGESGGGVVVQRYKGLGEMNPEQLWETTLDPERRILKKITIENAVEADHVFSMLMGDEVPPRREFIEQNAIYANIDV